MSRLRFIDMSLNPKTTGWLVPKLCAAQSGGAIVLVILISVITAGCRQDMHDQPRYKPLAHGEFFKDGQASREPVPGTVARGMLREDTLFYTGRLDGEVVQATQGPAPVSPASSQDRVGQGFADVFPFPITMEVLDRGETSYNVYCSVCHDRLGAGDGMIVRRGYRRPPSFHTERLRTAPAGYFFDVITNGFGAMPDYSAQISPADRWAVVAYVKALQLSQFATLIDVPAEERERLRRERQQ